MGLRAGASPASVVLCDVKMPIHDGLWLAERIRARWPEVPIVMITAAQDEDTVALSRQLGAFDYLTKPIAARQAVGRIATGVPASLREARTRRHTSKRMPCARGKARE